MVKAGIRNRDLCPYSNEFFCGEGKNQTKCYTWVFVSMTTVSSQFLWQHPPVTLSVRLICYHKWAFLSLIWLRLTYHKTRDKTDTTPQQVSPPFSWLPGWWVPPSQIYNWLPTKKKKGAIEKTPTAPSWKSLGISSYWWLHMFLIGNHWKKD